jgi:hypothetical protein
MDISQMSTLVSDLREQQNAIFALLDFEERPIIRPPATKESLQKLGSYLSASGRWLPDSYATFLRVCDGIENFCVSYNLLGIQDILGRPYEKIVSELLEHGVGYDHRRDLPPFLVAYDIETTTRVFLDFYHEQSVEGEPVVFEGEPGDMFLHASFAEFLRFRAQVNETTINHLRDLRDGKVDE